MCGSGSELMARGKNSKKKIAVVMRKVHFPLAMTAILSSSSYKRSREMSTARNHLSMYRTAIRQYNNIMYIQKRPNRVLRSARTMALRHFTRVCEYRSSLSLSLSLSHSLTHSHPISLCLTSVVVLSPRSNLILAIPPQTEKRASRVPIYTPQ